MWSSWRRKWSRSVRSLRLHKQKRRHRQRQKLKRRHSQRHIQRRRKSRKERMFRHARKRWSSAWPSWRHTRRSKRKSSVRRVVKWERCVHKLMQPRRRRRTPCDNWKLWNNSNRVRPLLPIWVGPHLVSRCPRLRPSCRPRLRNVVMDAHRPFLALEQRSLRVRRMKTTLVWRWMMRWRRWA